jgi:hypothetical protein
VDAGSRQENASKHNPGAAKALVFMKLFQPAHHYCDAVWPD